MTPISIRGASAHNLRSVDLTLQPGTLVVFRGPSGSGKSSLALDVVHAESRRRMLEVLRVPGSATTALPRVPVDAIDGLPPTIAVAPDDRQRADRPLLDMSDQGAILRSLFARHGTLMCPETGAPLRAWTTPHIVDDLARLPTGTRLTIGAPLPPADDSGRLLTELRRSGFARVRLGKRLVRLDDIDTLPRGVSVELVVDRIRWGPDRRDRLGEGIDTAWKAGQGTIRVDLGDSHRTYSRARQSPSGRTWPRARPEHFDRSRAEGACTACEGQGCDACDHSGWGDLARHTRLGGHTIASLLAAPLRTLPDWLRAQNNLPADILPPIRTLVALGLGHLPIGRNQRHLGRGEWRRATLARAVHLALSPRLLVVDEPLSGLDRSSAEKVVAVLRQVVDQGATVVVIEHRPEVLGVADRVVTFGPGGGPDGGTIVSDGPPEATPAWPAPTHRPTSSPPTWTVSHPHATAPVAIAADRWTVLTGPGGAGATRLAVQGLAAHFAGRPTLATVEGPEPRLLEPAPLAGASQPRSCVATAAGIWTRIRTLLSATRAARVRGLAADAFTFNRSTGWCPDCEGLGQRIVRFGSLPPITEPCPTCHGGRLRPDIDDIRWRGHSARTLLTTDIHQVRPLFAANPHLSPVLDALQAVGLGHLPLGRPTESLSSGERRRFAVALTLARLKAAERDPRPTLVVLDQPDTGLDDDTARTVARWMASSIAGRGTLVTVAHHPALIHTADAVVVLPAPDA